MVSGSLLSDKSARQCLTKNNSNKMRTGGRYDQSNLLFASSSARAPRRAPHNRVASKIDGWSPCACILFSVIQGTVKAERRLCAFTASLHCQRNSMRGAFISNLLQMPKIWPENWSGQKLAQQTVGGSVFLCSGPEFLVGS